LAEIFKILYSMPQTRYKYTLFGHFMLDFLLLLYKQAFSLDGFARTDSSFIRAVS